MLLSPRNIAILILCLTTGLTGAVGAPADRAQKTDLGRVTITFDGDVLDYSDDNKRVTAHGNVRVSAEASRLPGETLLISAEDLVGNLATGQITASRGIKVHTRLADLAGDSLDFNASSNEFKLTRAKCAVSLKPGADEGSVVRAFAFGDEISDQADVIYVIRGKVTTCDRESPHWSISARKIVFDSKHHEAKIQHPSVQLYGLRVPLLGSFTQQLPQGKQVSQSLLRFPSYSRRDGINFPYYLQFGPADGPVRADLDFSIGQKHGVRGLFHSQRGAYPWQVDLYASREVYSSTRLEDFLAIDQRPELAVTRYLRRPDGVRDQASIKLTAGHLTERDFNVQTPSAPAPTVATTRAGLIASYTGNWTANRDHVGTWWGGSAAKYWYHGGDSYHDLSLSAGTGCRLGDRSKAAVSVIRHFDGGFSPLVSDRAELKTEVQPYVELRVAPKWDLEAFGRYHWEQSRLRDYQVTLRNIQHCLSWTASYRLVGHHFALGVELNGLTNSIPDYHPKSVIPEAKAPEKVGK
jgi:hypothetical protein